MKVQVGKSLRKKKKQQQLKNQSYFSSRAISTNSFTISNEAISPSIASTVNGLAHDPFRVGERYKGTKVQRYKGNLSAFFLSGVRVPWQLEKLRGRTAFFLFSINLSRRRYALDNLLPSLYPLL